MKILFLNQAFFPDVVSTSQHAADLARAMAAEGHQITVVCSRRAYDSPSTTFPALEIWEGVTIRRIWSTGFGKAARWRRSLDFASFLGSCLSRLCTLGRFDCVVALTSPPLISFVGLLFARITARPSGFVANGHQSGRSRGRGLAPSRVLVGKTLGIVPQHEPTHAAARIVVLDRFMRERIVSKGISAERVSVIAPWIHSDAVHLNVEGGRLFRQRHGLSGKFVVMYSGNHSPCHPLDSLLNAATELRSEPDITFCFVGGGSEFKKVQEFACRRELKNVVCLPYQPLKDISASLSAADLHAVVMGDPFVGIVHPCKIYNIMALGIPVLYIGPAESHITDLCAGNWLFAEQDGHIAGIARQYFGGSGHWNSALCTTSACVLGTSRKEFAQEKLVKLLSAVILDEVPHSSARATAIGSSE